MNLTWKQDGSRIIGYCGEAAVGAVFPTVGRRTRWRAWVTKNMNPTEGTARNDGLAKLEVEKRFEGFLTLAALQPIPPRKPLPDIT